MAENRTERKLETREAAVRPKSWKAPEVLPTPDPVDGFEFHWVRVSTQGQVDAPNVSSKLREGWVPCKAQDHPEITLVAVENNRFKDNIVIGGLMLCKAPVEMVQERNAYYSEQANAQIRSVENSLLRENDARMPLFHDRKSEVSFGNGT